MNRRRTKNAKNSLGWQLSANSGSWPGAAEPNGTSGICASAAEPPLHIRADPNRSSAPPLSLFWLGFPPAAFGAPGFEPQRKTKPSSFTLCPLLRLGSCSLLSTLLQLLTMAFAHPPAGQRGKSGHSLLGFVARLQEGAIAPEATSSPTRRDPAAGWEKGELLSSAGPPGLERRTASARTSRRAKQTSERPKLPQLSRSRSSFRCALETFILIHTGYHFSSV